MSRRFWSVTSLTMTLLGGQAVFLCGSLRGEDIDPVAVDLVELAIAIPQAVSDIKDADTRLSFLTRQVEKGMVPQSELLTVQKQRESAANQLELLQFIVEAELKATSVRLEFLKARQKDVGIDAPVRITGAEQRVHVLSLFREACKLPKADDEQASRHPQDLPPTEAGSSGPALVADAIAP